MHERGDKSDITALTRGNQFTLLWRKNKSGGKCRGDQIADTVIKIRGQVIEVEPAQIIGFVADGLARISGYQSKKLNIEMGTLIGRTTHSMTIQSQRELTDLDVGDT